MGVTLSLAEIRECPDRGNVVKRMLIKCADVSSPARPLHICKVWAHRIAEEYFTQVTLLGITENVLHPFLYSYIFVFRMED